MFLTYNGVNLALTSIDRVHRDTVFSDDGTTVLYVETTLSVSAVYHPPIGGVPDLGGTSVAGSLRNPGRPATTTPTPRNIKDVRGSDPGQKSGLPPSPIFGDYGILLPEFPGLKTSGTDPASPCTLPNPGAEGWWGPIQTDRELELRLRTPRKKLLVWAFDRDGQPRVWIESPRQQNESDAKNGPVTLNCTVRSGPNPNTFFTALDIRTWATPCEDGSDRPLLSHRWQMSHIEDQNHYLTRLIRGTAVFNLGVLLATDQNPDWFRQQFFHPIPLGFERHLGPITLSSDGTTLSYEYYDTDVTCVFDPSDSGATTMEIVEKIEYNNPWRGAS